MSNYTATVIKSGNSYALRVPKALVDDKKLILGQKVAIDGINVVHKQNNGNIVKAIRKLQKLADEQGSMTSIKDVEAWQRKIRKEWDRPLPFRD